MKKMKFLIIGVVSVAVVAGVCLSKVGARADELVVNIEEDDNYENVKEIETSTFDKMLPVISALAGEIHTHNSAYNAYRSTFYERSLNRIIKYLGETDYIEYTEDDENYYFDSGNIYALTDMAFWGGCYTELEQFSSDAPSYYDRENKRYVVKKRDVELDYFVKIKKVTMIDGKHNGRFYCRYKVEAELYKGNEKIDNLKVYIEESEYMYNKVHYSVNNMVLENYGIEAWY